jgi:hypothetical protein
MKARHHVRAICPTAFDEAKRDFVFRFAVGSDAVPVAVDHIGEALPKTRPNRLGHSLMNLQNRVTPFGDIVAIPQQGTFTGNRGIIHAPATKTLLNKRWASKAWLVCVCDYKGRRREVMAGRSWTELFFLDEAVALAAGHRPCFLCRRKAADAFRAAWAAAKGEQEPSASSMDAALHRERLDHGRKRLHPLQAPVPSLPDGAVVA